MKDNERAPLGSLYRCAYRSHQVAHMTRADIATLLRGAQMRNLSQDITGLLLHIDNVFLHFVEGPEASVRSLLARLSKDPRHQGMGFWFIEPTAERLMPDHPMAFGDGGSPAPLPPALQAQLHMMLHGALPEASDPIASSKGQLEFWRFCAQSLHT